MARQIGDRILTPAIAPEQKSTLGSWAGSTFRFHSPAHERDWQQWAYRQSVDPDRWQQQPPVDHTTQSLLDGMPHLGSGQYFFGPDGKYRRSTMDLREDRDIVDIRRKAFNELAQSGVTWNELAQYPDDKPHPGEAEALAVREAKRAAAEAAAKAANAGQASDRFGPESAKPDLTRVAPEIGLDLAGESAEWGLPSNEPSSDPVLIATTDKAVSGLPKEVEKSQPFVTPSPLTPAQRRSFNEGLVGRSANDNNRSIANDNSPSVAPQIEATRIDRPTEKHSPGKPIVVGAEAAEEEKREVEDRLFNWRRNGYAPPAASEYAIYSASDEGRFVYLEEMKDEWSRLLDQDPEKVFRSMTGEVEKLSNAAMQDFVSGHHRQPNPAEKAEMQDAVAKMVFAPAEHWTKAGDKPNEELSEAKPFLGFIEPESIADESATEVLAKVSQVISQTDVEKYGGRLGTKETREMAALMTEKLAAAIKACGGKIIDTYHGKKERLIRRDRNSLKDASWTDAGTDFEYNGKKIGAYTNHSGTRADGRTLLANEAKQIYKLAGNLARAIGRGDLEITVAGFGYFSKRKLHETLEQYYRKMDEFISDMIDCGRPFLVRANVMKFEDVLPETANEDVSSEFPNDK